MIVPLTLTFFRRCRAHLDIEDVEMNLFSLTTLPREAVVWDTPNLCIGGKECRVRVAGQLRACSFSAKEADRSDFKVNIELLREVDEDRLSCLYAEWGGTPCDDNSFLAESTWKPGKVRSAMNSEDMC